jgi:hypothetical protein
MVWLLLVCVRCVNEIGELKGLNAGGLAGVT